MILGTIFLIILYLILKYTVAWISYYNNLDPRLETALGDLLMIILLWAKEIFQI